MYIRFVSTRRHARTGVLIGVFQTRLLLRRHDPLPAWQAARLHEIKDWFDVHLEKPTRVARSRRPNGTHAAISWFKASAHEHIAYARELAGLLDAHGIPTRMVTTDRPGYIVYEDAHQIAAEPFRDDHPDQGV